MRCRLRWGLLASVLVSSVIHAGEIHRIGGQAAPGAFADARSFLAAVPCVRGGDRIEFAAGHRHLGTLGLRLCADSAKGVVEVTTAGNGPPATLDASQSARDLGMSWKPVGQAPSQVSGVDVVVMSLGPLAGEVVQVFGPDGPLVPAAWPDAPDGGLALARIDTVTRQGSQCKGWICVSSNAPGWPAQIAAMAEATAERRPSVILRNTPWSYTRHEILSIDTRRGQLSLAQADGSTGTEDEREFVQPGMGLLIQGNEATLDSAGEWWFDRSQRVVHVAVQASRASELASALRVVVGTGRGGAEALVSLRTTGTTPAPDVALRIHGLRLDAAPGSAVTAGGIGSLEVSNVRIRYPAEHGVAASAISSLAVLDSDIRGTGNNGVFAYGVSDVRIERNRIADAGRIGTQPRLVMQFNGVRAYGFNRVDVHDNEIRRVGYAGIMLGERDAFTDKSAPGRLSLRGNVIERFCSLLNDCGAIYINGSRRGQKPVIAGDGAAKQIIGNRIGDPRPLMAGLPGDGGAKSPQGDQSGVWVRMVGAVYLDQGASGYDVQGNTISGHYSPYGWNIFNAGIENACSRASVTQCKAGPNPYRCYTDALAQCNEVPRSTTR